ncbi:hypothetical protein QJQ45_004515 [Haematococcus lacustris]|nr:hypothetical protein QJQ45_004515 [Haematococcus lacustris]
MDWYNLNLLCKDLSKPDKLKALHQVTARHPPLNSVAPCCCYLHHLPDLLTTIITQPSPAQPSPAQPSPAQPSPSVAADISVRRGLWDFTAREDYPLFSEAATRLLSMHITTAAAERNWSAWGDTFEAGRAQLGIKKAEMMVYIHANIPKGASTMPSELVALGITA